MSPHVARGARKIDPCNRASYEDRVRRLRVSDQKRTYIRGRWAIACVGHSCCPDRLQIADWINRQVQIENIGDPNEGIQVEAHCLALARACLPALYRAAMCFNLGKSSQIQLALKFSVNSVKAIKPESVSALNQIPVGPRMDANQHEFGSTQRRQGAKTSSPKQAD